MWHAAFVDREDGFDLTQLVGCEPLVGLIAVALDDAALFLDVDKGVAIEFVSVLVRRSLHDSSAAVSTTSPPTLLMRTCPVSVHSDVILSKYAESHWMADTIW